MFRHIFAVVNVDGFYHLATSFVTYIHGDILYKGVPNDSFKEFANVREKGREDKIKSTIVARTMQNATNFSILKNSRG